MYQDYWKLQKTPFRTNLDPRFFYESPVHEEALARLHFLVEQQRRFGLLLGVAGSGKSLLLTVFAEQMRRAGRPTALVNVQGIESDDLLWELSAQFGLNPPRDLSTGALWRRLVDRVKEYRYQQWETVVLLDDADHATGGALETLLRLVQLDRSPESRLTVVVAGHRKRLTRLGMPLLELAELQVEVEPWEPADTARYVEHSLARAGRQEPLFALPALERLHELTAGIPRRVTQLADLALLAGAGQQLDEIDAELVQAAFEELGVLEV